MSQDKSAQTVRRFDLDGFGGRLREAFQGAKNAQIARELDVSEAAVRNYIEGRIPAAETLAFISKRTNCSIHWLVTGEGPKIVRRVDFKNLWARIVQAWDAELKDSGDQSLKAELVSAKDMAKRRFLPDYSVVERVSNIAKAPLLWLLTGEGPSRVDKFFANQPIYLVDLIADYKAKEALPLPLKNQLMSTDIRRIERQSECDEPIDEGLTFTGAEAEALEKLARKAGTNVAEKVHDIVISHLLAQNMITLQEILWSHEESKDEDPRLQMTDILAETGASAKKRA